jgi:hypothetical protein
MMKGMRNCYLRLCFAASAMILGLTGCNYEDGPVISLRSRGDRMDFYRPMTYFENNGFDSTEALNAIFFDSIPGFIGRFYFDWKPNEELLVIHSSEDDLTSTSIGFWFIDGYNDFERIFIYGISGQTWPALNAWTITRLTHRKLWLEGPGGRLLRFEE